MKIAIASGKGGTGKTLVSVNLAVTNSKETLLLDCDVEEPNDRVFFDELSQSHTRRVSIKIPRIDNSVCISCKACVNACQFNALAMLADRVMIFDELCHACGACAYVCPPGAISWIDKPIGTITGWAGSSVNLIQGQMDVGISMPVPLIRELKKEALYSHETVILDSPPGTSCPMVWTVLGCDAALLVTEPTPFGLHDLQLAVDTIRTMGMPFGVVINKDGIGDDQVDSYCNQEHIPIMGRIGYDLMIAKTYARGKIFVEQLEHYRAIFSSIWDNIERLVGTKGTSHG